MIGGCSVNLIDSWLSSVVIVSAYSSSAVEGNSSSGRAADSPSFSSSIGTCSANGDGLTWRASLRRWIEFGDI
jgi:hypothetical protein